MTDEEYTHPQVEPEDYFKGSFGVYHAQKTEPVELHFKSSVAPYVVERRWHASQRVVKNGDGSVTLNLEVGITPDLVQFVLGFGDAVEVRKPESLKQEVVTAARKVAEMYR